MQQQRLHWLRFYERFRITSRSAFVLAVILHVLRRGFVWDLFREVERWQFFKPQPLPQSQTSFQLSSVL